MGQFHQELLEKNPDAARTLKDSTQLLFEAWKFDANRISQMRASGKPAVYSNSEITDYVTNMELYSIMKGALAILGEEPEKVELLKPLVLAARRHHYFLRDVAEDVAEGCFNISREELGNDIQYLDDFVEHSRKHSDLLDNSRKEFASLPYFRRKLHSGSFEASQKALIKAYFDTSPDSVKSWAKSQVEQGNELLTQYNQSEASNEFGLLTRIFLFSCYERRAAKFFDQMSRTLE